MQKPFGRYLVASLLITLLASQISFAQAISDVSAAPREVEKVERVPEPVVSETPPADDPYSEKALKNTFFLYQLQQDLKNATQDYRSSNSVTSVAQEKLNQTRESLSTLRQQITLMNEQIQTSEKKILNVADQIAFKEQEIEKMKQEVEIRKAALEDQKKLLESYVRMQYVQENDFFENGENGLEMSTVKIIFSDRSLSDTFDEISSVSLFQEAGARVLDKLAEDMKVFEGLSMSLENKKLRLDDLQQKLQNERQHLDDQKFSKARLLADTHGDEERYQELIAQSLSQQEESLLQIRALQDNMKYVQRKLQDFGADVSYSELKDIVDQRTKEFYDYQYERDENTQFQWPVAPNRGISAYFRDSGYKARFGVGHNAVDVPTAQGTPIRAPKDGYVYKVKDNGLGYSYIILSHKDQFTTVYGHVSEILVAEKDFVKEGTVIGLTGGAPGTKGAGHMTTGAHLHFEVLKEGQYVDPLDYLSLTKLPLESLPERYVQKIETQQKSAPALPEGYTAPVKDEDLESIIEESEKKHEDEEDSTDSSQVQ